MLNTEFHPFTHFKFLIDVNDKIKFSLFLEVDWQLIFYQQNVNPTIIDSH
jgi:hypothetical protein